MLCSRVWTSIFAAYLLVICTVSVHSQSESPRRLNVDAKEKIVKGGEQFEFTCRAGRPIETCSIKFSNQNSGIKMRENAKKDDYEYLGGGYAKGDCGIRYYSIKPDQHGNVTCTVGFADIDVESIGFTNLIVAIAPTSVNFGKDSKNEFKEGEEMRFSCTAIGGRPASSVSLLLDNNTLATSSKMQDTVNFNRVATFKDNNKKLVCRATHQALDEPKMTEKTLKIMFKPQPINQFGGATIQKFGFFEGKDGVIEIDVFANPKPRFEWKINGEYPDRQRYMPGDNQRLQQNEETGAWLAELAINPVMQEDLNKDFILTATNEFGYEVYNIKISFDPTPAEVDETGVGAGTIVVIIVAVLIVFVAIVLTLLARSTGRWCFAAGVPPPGDKEAPEDSPSHARSGGWWGRLTNSYRAVATVEETTTLPKSLDPKTNTAPRAVVETNLDDEESGGVLHSSDTESADKVPAADVPAAKRLYNNLMQKINSLRPTTKVPTSEEEANKDAEAAEQKLANATAGVDGVVYAELEMRKPGEPAVIRETDDKTEYAQIVIPTAAKV